MTRKPWGIIASLAWKSFALSGAIIIGYILWCVVRMRPSGQGVVDIGGAKVRVDILDNSASRSRGMMGMTSVPPGTGKLFLYRSASPSPMWMKGCSMPIRMIFVGPDWKVQGNHVAYPDPEGITDPDRPRHVAGGPLPKGVMDDGKTASIAVIEVGVDEWKSVTVGDGVSFRKL